MPAFARQATFVAALASVAVVGVLLFKLVPMSPGFTPPPPTPTTVPAPTSAGESPASSSASLTYRWPRPLDAGRYATSMAWDLPFAMAFTVPAGWESRDVEVIRGAMSVSMQLPWDLFEDPCSASSSTIDSGASTLDFAHALAAVPGLTVGTPAATTFGGFTGTSVTYEATSVACVGESSALWSNPEWMILPVTPLGPPTWPVRAGVHRLWILEAPSVGRLVIDATAGAGATAADGAAVQAILDSIEFVPPTEARAIGACSVALTMPANPSQAVAPDGTVPMGTGTYPIKGPVSADLFGPPYAQVDFRVSGVTGSGPPSDRPWAKAVPPTGSTATGAATLTSAPEAGSPDVVGSFLLDGPGTWWIGVSIPYANCAWQQPIRVTAG